jgi:hypothetical protein
MGPSGLKGTGQLEEMIRISSQRSMTRAFIHADVDLPTLSEGLINIELTHQAPDTVLDGV